MLVDSADYVNTRAEDDSISEFNSNLHTDRENNQTTVSETLERASYFGNQGPRDSESQTSMKQKLLSLCLNRPNDVDQYSPDDRDQHNSLIKLVPFAESVVDSDDRGNSSRRNYLSDNSPSLRVAFDNELNLTAPPQNSPQQRVNYSEAIRREFGLPSEKAVSKSYQDISKNKLLQIEEIIPINNGSFKNAGLLNKSLSKGSTCSARTHNDSQGFISKTMEKKKRNKTPKIHVASERSRSPPPLLNQTQGTPKTEPLSTNKLNRSSSKKNITSASESKKIPQSIDHDQNYISKNFIRQQEHTLDLAARRLNVTALFVSLIWRFIE